MPGFLKDHPFAVAGFFESSLVLTYAVEKEQLQKFLPRCLQPDVFKERWGFIAAAMVQTKQLRPKGFPGFMGQDFFLAGYRLFVNYQTSAGKRLRGLYILRSETDRRRMTWLGNLFTHYGYRTTDILLKQEAAHMQIRSEKSGIDIEVSTQASDPSLPAGSPFDNWREARRFAGPLPFTFSFQPSSKKVLIVEGVRQNWSPGPVEVIRHRIGFIEQLGLKGLVLANAFMVQQVPYFWKKGRTDRWQA